MSMSFIYIIFLVFFCLYHLVSFYFASYVFAKNSFPLLRVVIVGVVNVSFWLLYPTTAFFGNEFILIILFSIILFFEYKFVFLASNPNALFLALSFSINLFSKRMMLLASSVIFRSSITSYTLAAIDIQNFYLSLAISFMISIGAILFCRVMLSRSSLDTILSDKQNMIFATTLLLIIFVLISGFTLLGANIPIDVENFNFQYILIGFVSLGGFTASILYAYHLSNLRLTIDNYNKISSENAQEIKLIKELETTAATDFLTLLSTRDVADNLIDEYVKSKQKFFITFVDMDNLKVANDDFGHEEGDFYIKKVAGELKLAFPNELISRYGGDEFVIIGKFAQEEEVHSKMLKCFSRIGALKNVYSKPYDTSISYGTVFVPTSNGLTAEKLISIADHRMYQFKKQKKHHRQK